MSWMERVLGDTRVRLLVMLRRATTSINGMAGAIGISDNAVRTHVAAMQRDGMVEPAGVERGTGGKPAQLYRLTPEAEEIFPKAYAVVLNTVLELLEERDGRAAVEAVLREAGSRAAGATAMAGEDAGERVHAAADALRRLGGDVEVVRGDDGWLIRGYGCPLSGVVTEHEVACTLAESLVARITGGNVTECCERGDRARCRFAVDFAPAPER